ncbi:MULTISPECIES: excinuclease ABC subunit UvrA [Paenibacillus]|uniref:excinuclease ABC subunit UvrA n=1 Tax=Paenibacillus TaxID=44249 RepID=UPI00096F8A82|nr:excinuclease ABC subunit UvrA [Paenibacillus odorifer]OME44188.1 excinuclease ABC subunit A [Paenibacillus odorifer]
MQDEMNYIPTHINVQGANANNLKNINIDIPLNRLVAITGVSGSGKSSLAMDTIYAEGTRRYLNALSTYTRRRIKQVGRSDVKAIKNLPSTIALRQRPDTPGIRSTVGTLTETLNILRLIFSRLGSHVCPNGHRLEPTLRVAEVMDFMGTDERMGIINCPTCEVPFMVYGAESFAFNSDGACSTCQGTGEAREIQLKKIIPNPDLTIKEGAVASWRLPGRTHMHLLAEQQGVRLDLPFKELTDKEKEIVLHGPEVKRVIVVPTSTGKSFELNAKYENAFVAVENSFNTAKNENTIKRLNRFYDVGCCSRCHGTRYNPELFSTLIMGKNIAEVSHYDLLQLEEFSDKLVSWVPAEMKNMAEQLSKELRELIEPIVALGLDYLTLDRAGNGLSTGELQRIQLARTIRNQMTGILYVLDEPSVGLHAENVQALIQIIRQIIRQGNSVLVVDHDVAILEAADYLIEIGPLSGEDGGEVIGAGTPSELSTNDQSVIAAYLNKSAELVVRNIQDANQLDKMIVTVKGKNNIHEVRAEFVLNGLNVVTGISGSGKTTLVLDSLVPAMKARLAKEKLPDHVALTGEGKIKQVVEIDSNPIGKNIRSTVSTYSKIMDKLRKLFETEADQTHAFKATDFSYNNNSGACTYCEGTGSVNLDIQYLPDIVEVCPQCQGKRYKDEILDVTLQGKNIAEVLELTVAEAQSFFENQSSISKTLKVLNELGLGYLHLGESTPALSGGEAQRLKLTYYLEKKQANYLFIFDEPSIGLHPRDVATLVGVLDKLVQSKATVIVIEHDLDVIANADYIVDMGPNGGRYGGQLMANGSVEQICRTTSSVTGKYMKNYLA